MIRTILLFLCILCIPISIHSQVRITEKKVEEVLIQLEDQPVDILELKTMKKYKALNLSNDMRSQMDYNVVRVKYETEGQTKIVLIDSNLVPIRYDYLMLADN